MKLTRRLISLLAVCLLTPSVFMHYPAQAIAPDSITVQGRGWGHGRGLQQWGALGYAIDHFWSYEQILQHYYLSLIHI